MADKHGVHDTIKTSEAEQQLSVTEITYLEIDESKDLKDEHSESGHSWHEVLALNADFSGFIEQYWGRGMEGEFPQRVRLHVVRSTLEEHQAFHASAAGERAKAVLWELTNVKPTIRHALMQDFSASEDGCLARHAPATGSAIYLNSTDVFHSYSWPLWTHIVRHAPGNKGVAGGRIIDHENGQDAYLVYVGWDTNDSHQAFRKSPACADRRVILTLGTDEQTEYYHTIFEN